MRNYAQCTVVSKNLIEIIRLKICHHFYYSAINIKQILAHFMNISITINFPSPIIIYSEAERERDTGAALSYAQLMALQLHPVLCSSSPHQTRGVRSDHYISFLKKKLK